MEGMHKNVENGIEGFERHIHCGGAVQQGERGGILASEEGWKIVNMNAVIGCRGPEEERDDGGMIMDNKQEEVYRQK